MRRYRAFLLLLTAFSTFAMTASAQDSETTRPWVIMNFGGGSYAMERANDEIQTTGESALFDHEQVSLLEFEEISDGLGFGLGIGVDVGDIFRMGLHFQRIRAEASSRALVLTTGTADQEAAMEFNFPASALYVALAAMRPLGGRMSYGLEAGAGVTLSGAEAVRSGADDAEVTIDMGGAGPFIVGRAMFDTRITNYLELAATAGYRYAVTNEMSSGGTPILDNDMQPFSIDYSGFEGQVGLRFYFVGAD